MKRTTKVFIHFPQLISGCPVPIKVMVATQIGGNKEEITHEELVRLYIKVDHQDDDNDDESMMMIIVR